MSSQQVSRSGFSEVMEMIRSRETLKECLSLSEGWSPVDIVRAAAREGYGFDPTTGIPSQVGVAHAAGMLVDFERGDKPKRTQRGPRGMEPIREHQCNNDDAHEGHEWILGGQANGVVRSCRGWTAEQITAAEVALVRRDDEVEPLVGDVHQQIKDEVALADLKERRSYIPNDEVDSTPGWHHDAAGDPVFDGPATVVDTVDLDEPELTDEDRKMLANPHGCYICRDPADHDGKPHGEVTGDGMTREVWRGQWRHQGKAFSVYGDVQPDGWFPFGTHAGPEHAGIRLVFSDETDEVGDPFWEKPYEGFGGAVETLMSGGRLEEELVDATATPVAVEENELTGSGAPFIPEIEQLVLWASRWEPEIPDAARPVRILAEGLLAAVRDLHGYIRTWESTVLRERMTAEVERLKGAYESALATLMAMPEPEDASRPQFEGVNDRSQPVAGPGDTERSVPTHSEAPRPVLLGQAVPLVHKPYHRSVTTKLLDALRVDHGIPQQDVRAWAVEAGLASGRGGLSVEAVKGFYRSRGIACSSGRGD